MSCEHDDPIGELVSDFYSKYLGDVAKATKEGKQLSKLSQLERSVSRTGLIAGVGDKHCHYPSNCCWPEHTAGARQMVFERKNHELLTVTVSSTEGTTDVDGIEIEWVSVEGLKHIRISLTIER